MFLRRRTWPGFFIFGLALATVFALHEARERKQRHGRKASERIGQEIRQAQENGDLAALVRWVRLGHLEAVRSLGAPRFKEAEPLLRECLGRDDLKVEAALALARIDPERNRSCLIQLADDPRAGVRYAAILALKEFPCRETTLAILPHLEDQGRLPDPPQAFHGGPIGFSSVRSAAFETLGDLFDLPKKGNGE